MVDYLLSRIDEIKRNSMIPVEPISIIFDSKGDTNWTIDILVKGVSYESLHQRLLVSLSFIKDNKSWIRIKFFSQEDIDFYSLAPYKMLKGIETVHFGDEKKYKYMNREINNFFDIDKESIYNQTILMLDEIYDKIKK